MALSGNLQKIEWIDHETETVDWITIDDNGAETTTQAPKKVKNPIDYNNVYLTIKQIDFFTQCCSNTSSIVFIYAVYSSQQTRTDDVEDYLYTETGMLYDYDHDVNLYQQVYNTIKLQEGNTNLIDA